MDRYDVHPVAHVVGGRIEVADDDWGGVEAVLRLEPHVPSEAVLGLDEFSHLEVVFLFHLADPARTTTGARRPRGNPEWPEVGIFAQRMKDRPNRLGVSRCELVAVSGRDVTVRGLDAVHGTPVLDVKPWMAGFGPRGTVREPAWSGELMSRYW